MEKILVIANNINLPRVQRRIRALHYANIPVAVFAFQRDLFKINRFQVNVELYSLGEIPNINYLKRIPAFKNAFFRIRAYQKYNPVSTFYCFGLDSALLALMCGLGKRKMIYEIADLRYDFQVKNLKNKIISSAERRVLGRTEILVLTSEGHFEQFKRILPRIANRITLIENKVPQFLPDLYPRVNKPHISRGRIRLGFIGAIRYEACLFPLIEEVGLREDELEFHIYGDGRNIARIAEYCQTFRNIFYHGPFTNPGQLKEVYENIDLNIVVYDNLDFNVRRAIPNKLFESIYFGVPLVVSDNTLLGKKVDSLGIGFTIDPQINGYARNFIDNLRRNEIFEKANICLNIPIEAIVTDHSPLLKEIEKFSTHE